MDRATAHVAIFDGYSDWEIGHLLAELRTGRFTTTSLDVVTVAEDTEPIRSMGGVRVVPDMLLENLDPSASDVLVLPGGDMWDAGGGAPFASAADRFLDASVPVAAICGGTAGLARAGLLDDRKHTSASPEYLGSTGYGGTENYVDVRAVVDGDLITAGPQSPIQFACATLGRLGLASEQTLEAYEALFDRGDGTAFPVLMQASAPAAVEGDDLV